MAMPYALTKAILQAWKIVFGLFITTWFNPMILKNFGATQILPQRQEHLVQILRGQAP